MTNKTHYDSPRLELLHHTFNKATEDASAAMSTWTNGQISLSLDELSEVSLESVSEDLNLGMEFFTMVVMTLDGEVGGTMILTFDEKNGRQLAATLINREVETDEVWSDLEKSALNETGNILGCAYLNALSDLVSANLVPSPPYFIQDYGASVLEQALMEQAITEDKVLICRTTFCKGTEELNWNVFFIPNSGMRTAMEKSQKASC
ncbi:MAG: chemotaxis protein [Blastopirellula sp.]|nr:MAG: chemotaxis protein [Blastopirellula sp.]